MACILVYVIFFCVTLQPELKSFKYMKKSTLWSMALVALTLVSQGLRAQDCAFTPAIFPGQAADRYRPGSYSVQRL